MKKTNLFLLIAVTCSLFYSCQKEIGFEETQNPATAEIQGEYDFVGLSANIGANATAPVSIGQIKIEIASQFTTTNNAGTAKFTSDQFIYTGLAYSANSPMASVKTYVNGILLDETSMPVDLDSPPADGTFNYIRNNKDSITFPNPILGITDPFSSGGPTAPMGAKISWSGDTLLLQTTYPINTTISDSGLELAFTGSVNGTMKFKKK